MPGSDASTPIPLTAAERDPWYPLDLAVARVVIARKTDDWRELRPVGRHSADGFPAAAKAAVSRGVGGQQLSTLASSAGASRSELGRRLQHVYDERGTPPPSGTRAWVLTANALLREISESAHAGDIAASAIWALASYGPDPLRDPLNHAADYREQFHLVAIGMSDRTAASVQSEFRAECAAILLGGGISEQ